MNRVNRKQLYFIGLVGSPYYLVVTIVISQLTEVSAWSLVLFLPALYLYDRFSQHSYISKVIGNKYGNLQYAVRSLSYQMLVLGVIIGGLYVATT